MAPSAPPMPALSSMMQPRWAEGIGGRRSAGREEEQRVERVDSRVESSSVARSRREGSGSARRGRSSEIAYEGEEKERKKWSATLILNRCEQDGRELQLQSLGIPCKLHGPVRSPLNAGRS
jgi:hypothetical protein